MFKRIERRIRKKEKEEELGLDEETKEILGLNVADTDSDESDSSSGLEGDSEGEDQEAGLGEDGDASDAEEDVVGEDEVDEESSEEDEDEEDEEDEPPMSVSEALQDPLWHVSLEPEVKACAVCPGKLLKNPIMIDVHMKSGAHKRRFTKLREAAMNVDPETEVRDLVRPQRLASLPEEPAEGRLSKRAEKKKAKLAAIKAKRAKQKVMKAKYRAKKEAKGKAVAESDAAISESESEDGADASRAKFPAAKKRKVDRDVEDEAQAPKATPSPKRQKPSGGETNSKSLASTKAFKPPKKSITDIPSNLPEKPPAKSKQRPMTKSTTSPLKAAVSKDSKIAKKRKRPDAAS